VSISSDEIPNRRSMGPCTTRRFCTFACVIVISRTSHAPCSNAHRPVGDDVVAQVVVDACREVLKAQVHDDRERHEDRDHREERLSGHRSDTHEHEFAEHHERRVEPEPEHPVS